jgi:hypothetical protein
MHIRERVEFHLDKLQYPTDLDTARAEDTENVTAQVKWVLSEFDCATEVVGVEQTLGYYYRGTDACAACLFRAKIDLLLAHTDGTLEYVDFKGGKVKPDPIQEVISRIVVAAEFGKHYPEIRTTTLFVAAKKRVSAVLEREACREAWETIKRAAAEIRSGLAAWDPSPSPFCTACPYFNNGCSISPECNGADHVAVWLDGDRD